MSSLAAIGPWQTAGYLINEATKPSPVTAYGKSKLLAEEQISSIKLPLLFYGQLLFMDQGIKTFLLF